MSVEVSQNDGNFNGKSGETECGGVLFLCVCVKTENNSMVWT